MATVRYRGVANRGSSGFAITFPDIPEISVAGKTVFEAVDLAENALKRHLERCVEDGRALPLPSLEKSQRDAAQAESVFAFDVEIPEAPVCVRILLDAKTVTAIDEVSSDRSRFLAAAIQQALAANWEDRRTEAGEGAGAASCEHPLRFSDDDRSRRFEPQTSLDEAVHFVP